MVSSGSPAGFVGAFPRKSVKYRDESETFGCNQNVNTRISHVLSSLNWLKKSVYLALAGVAIWSMRHLL